MATAPHRFSVALLHWGWFLLATVVLLVGIVDPTDGVLVIVDHLSDWPPSDPGMKDGSPITAAVLGIIIAAFGIWLTVRLVNRGKTPSAKFCVCTVLVIALGALSICLPIWLPYQWEQQIVEEIEGCGGRVYTETGGPFLLRWFVGTDRMKKCRVFERVHGVTLFSAEVPDAGIAQLNSLPNLEHVHLDVAKVTAAGLVDLRGFKILECHTLSVSLNRTMVTDDDLAHLSRLTNLTFLWLDGTAVTDFGLTHLSGLTGLQFLDLSRTAVTDAGLAHLSEMKNLRSLFLNDTDVTDAGLAKLARCTNLWGLGLSNTGVTDDGLSQLSRFPYLGDLDLRRTAVSDSGLVHLRGLKYLRRIDLSGTAVTATGIKELQNALSQCAILH